MGSSDTVIMVVLGLFRALSFDTLRILFYKSL